MSIGMQRSLARRFLGVLVLLMQTGVPAQTAPATAIAASPQAVSSAAGLSVRGDPVRGKVLYQGCSGCHSVDENDIGPKHRGVVGRLAGTAPDYAYSAALKTSGIVWNPVTLDRWLTNPSAMVPGTKMFFLLADPQDRADVIAYLAELK